MPLNHNKKYFLLKSYDLFPGGVFARPVSHVLPSSSTGLIRLFFHLCVTRGHQRGRFQIQRPMVNTTDGTRCCVCNKGGESFGTSRLDPWGHDSIIIKKNIYIYM